MDENLSQLPALEPPEGITPNFDNPPSIHRTHVIVASIILALSVVAIAARTFTRTAILRKFDFSDASLLLSLAIMIPYVSLTMNMGNFGQGRHQWNVPLSMFYQFLKFINIIEILYCPLVYCARYTVIRQIQTIFLQHQHQSLSNRGVLILLWGNAFFYLALMFSCIFACTPREKIWNPSLEGKCVDSGAIFKASGSLNLIADVTILVLPLAALWSLQMSRKQKLKAALIFAIGAFAAVASTVRLYYSIKLTQTEDITYAIEPFGYWTEIEYVTVVLTSCCPLFPLLLQHVIQKNKQLSYLKVTPSQSASAFDRTDRSGHHVINLTENAGVQDIEMNTGFPPPI
ncbi:hypothetical protein F5B19DRAFT_440642 [Rostrohypoxylon terebratum]|nr:hypothetical protein F5B19DRAFT_440642 [Rostrohypoxylon terebratum]